MPAAPPRAGLLAVLGSAPATVPLDLQVGETQEFPTYRQHLIEYTTVGAERVSERFRRLAYDSGHTFRRDMRDRSYAWFDHWLAPA
jgi:hypothetical protein